MKNRELEKREIRLVPIGAIYRTEEEDVTKIVVRSEYVEGLDGIEELDHIHVLYWMHRLNERDRKTLKVHPQGDANKPLRGVFALRSPVRPNPIGLTRVELVKREGNILFVKGLDALEGSPLIDIKSG